jgi:hypothetical protein
MRYGKRSGFPETNNGLEPVIDCDSDMYQLESRYSGAGACLSWQYD